MKTIFTKMIWLVVVMNAMSGFGQDVTPPIEKDSLRQTTKKYLFDTRKQYQNRYANVVFYNSPFFYLNRTNFYYNNLYNTFNNKMLNVFFENEINSFATNISDLSLDKYIVSANTDSKTLTIGRTLDLRAIFYDKNSRPLQPLSNLLTFYVKNKLEKGFSNIYSQNSKTNLYDFSSDIGIGLKFTHIGNGIIYFGDLNHTKKEKIRRIREEIIFPAINDEINKYIKYTSATNSVSTNSNTTSTSIIGGTETTVVNSQSVTNGVVTKTSSTTTTTSVPPLTDSNSIKNSTTITTVSTPSKVSQNEDEKIYTIVYSDPKLTEKNQDLVTEKYYLFYKKIADKEIEILKKEELYSSYLTWWAGFDAYYGLNGKDTYYKGDLTTNTMKDTVKYRDYKIDLYANVLWSYKKSITVNGKLQFNSANTNNFIISEKTANTFETIATLPNNQQTVTGTQLVFIGDYDEFITCSTRYELSFLAFQNTIGLSGALEHFYGTYKARNWKVGMPISFKDKDKKPTLNFELQWKEVNKLHFLGFSVGYAFGKFLK